jgi:hypothetical protein
VSGWGAFGIGHWPRGCGGGAPEAAPGGAARRARRRAARRSAVSSSAARRPPATGSPPPRCVVGAGDSCALARGPAWHRALAPRALARGSRNDWGVGGWGAIEPPSLHLLPDISVRAPHARAGGSARKLPPRWRAARGAAAASPQQRAAAPSAAPLACPLLAHGTAGTLHFRLATSKPTRRIEVRQPREQRNRPAPNRGPRGPRSQYGAGTGRTCAGGAHAAGVQRLPRVLERGPLLQRAPVQPAAPPRRADA